MQLAMYTSHTVYIMCVCVCRSKQMLWGLYNSSMYIFYVLISDPLPVIHSSVVVGCLASKREVPVRIRVMYFLFFLFN